MYYKIDVQSPVTGTNTQFFEKNNLYTLKKIFFIKIITMCLVYLVVPFIILIEMWDKRHRGRRHGWHRKDREKLMYLTLSTDWSIKTKLCFFLLKILFNESLVTSTINNYFDVFKLVDDEYSEWCSWKVFLSILLKSDRK